VVISESYEIQYVSGNVQSFLQFNPGAMSTNILRQCKKDLEIILGQTIQRAIKTSESTYSAPRQLKNKENFELFRFLVHPMLHFKETHYLVIYESMAVEYQAITTEKVSNKEFENIQVSELQLELANTREHLKSYIEELETSNEEMQALNEELQSTNEELQSVNDELETSNEEIQSAHAKMQGAYKVLNEVNDLIRLKEKEMLKANAQLESILNNDSQGLILCNENFEILHFNQYAYNAIAGINGQKIKVKNGLLSYLPKQWVGDFIDLVKMSISSDIDSKKQLTIELKSGEKQHFIVSLSPVQSNLPEGPKITISLLNNTEEFQLNEHLDQMNKLLDQVSDVVKIGGWELDVKTLKITWTKGVYDIHQVGHAFQTDLNVSLDFYEDKDRLEMKRLINNTIKTGKSFEGSFNFRDALKNQMLVEVKGFPRFRNGEMQSVWGTIQDITETQVQQQQNETKNRELTRSNKELEEFAYIASHDLQEPLRMIYSFIEILEDQYKDSFDDDGKQYLGFITNGARRMQAMLSDLLVYSRVSDNHESFKLVNLDVLIKEVLINLETSIIAKKSMVDISELAAIKGVPSLLSRLFQNLIANSIKYNNRIPQISIWCEKSKKKENHISLYIKDNGIGIDSTHFQHIFGIFKRLHTEQEYPGSGIGLAICKRIMIKHDGDIEVLNSSNEGTVFHLDFIAYEQ